MSPQRLTDRVRGSAWGLFICCLLAFPNARVANGAQATGGVQSAIAEYEKRAAACEKTADAHFQLAEWCKLNRLNDQRHEQLEQAIELDPNHAKARQALGFERLGEEWLPEEEAKARAGLVRYDGRWRSKQAVKLAEEKKERDRNQKNWIRQLARLRKTLNTNFQLGRDQILQIKDPLAISAFSERMGNESNPAVRDVYALALANIGTPDAVKALVHYSLHDSDEEVRLNCVDELRIAGLGEVATGYYLPALQESDNVIVNRAAAALGELSAVGAVGGLVNAVNTSHTFRMAAPPSGQTNVGFGTGPNGGGGGLATGSRPPQKVTRLINNQSVIDALQSITGQNFGFDEDAWKSWYASTKPQIGDVDIRRD